MGKQGGRKMRRKAGQVEAGMGKDNSVSDKKKNRMTLHTGLCIKYTLHA